MLWVDEKKSKHVSVFVRENQNFVLKFQSFCWCWGWENAEIKISCIICMFLMFSCVICKYQIEGNKLKLWLINTLVSLMLPRNTQKLSFWFPQYSKIKSFDLNLAVVLSPLHYTTDSDIFSHNILQSIVNISKQKWRYICYETVSP